MDVICSRLYFWDVQEEVLTQSSGQGISAPRTELSIIGLLQQKNKHGDRGNVFVNIPVSGSVWEILDKSKVIASVNS